MKCARCNKESWVHTTSYFNEDDICMVCRKKEMEHPLYEYARKMELEAVKAGDLNFKGIGCPEDLYEDGSP